MTIQNDSAVSIDYTLKDDTGEVLDTSEGASPLWYLHGHQNIVPGLEEALTGKAEGDSVSVTVPPDRGYGERDEERVFQVNRSRMPEDLELEEGIMLRMQGPDGASIPLVVTKVEEDTVTVDANHALAGKTLHFEISIRTVRDATKEELEHGHVHEGDHAH